MIALNGSSNRAYIISWQIPLKWVRINSIYLSGCRQWRARQWYAPGSGCQVDFLVERFQTVDWCTSKPFNNSHFSEGSVIGPDELPPPYEKTGGVPMVSCRVCQVHRDNLEILDFSQLNFSVQAMIDISGKKDQHVVKCNSCNEATPIRNAPPGRKWESYWTIAQQMLQHTCNQEEVKLEMTLTNSYFSGMCDVLVTASSSAKAAPRELLAPGLFYLIFF